VDTDQIPPEILNWIESSIYDFNGQVGNWQNGTLILVTYGMKGSSGYDVKITDISEGLDGVVTIINSKKMLIAKR